MPSPECPQCGTPLAPGAVQGLCPRCLMAAAALPTEPTVADTPPEPEQVAAAFPQLEVLELIGRGGMGSVFKVRQPKLNRLAALKLLPHSLAEDPAFAGRFEREAQLLARLNHPNIVAVYDYGLTGGFFYLLMEFVDGVNLRQAMRTARFTPAQALAIVPKICEALQFAHEEGILHRDIKPENLLLDAKGRVKLADFGIAKIAAESEAGSGAGIAHGSSLLTQAGSALGTPDYMAPEQRERPAEVDHRADIYSLGVVFYEILTGELPRAGVFVPPSGMAAVGPRVDAIVRQALESERERRQSSAGEMKTQVENAGTIASASGPVPPPRPAGENSGVKLGRQKVKFTAPRERPPALPGEQRSSGSGAGMASVLAVLLGFIATWKDRGIEQPQRSSQVPVSFTEIGAGEPWLREVRWAAQGWLRESATIETGGISFAHSPWVLTELAMIAAGLCWLIWFVLKRRSGERLDSFLATAEGPLPLAITLYGLAACSFSLWLCFLLTALVTAFASPAAAHPLGPLSLNAIHLFAITLGIAWTVRAVALGRHQRSREVAESMPPVGATASCLFQLLVMVCLLPLAAFLLVVVWGQIAKPGFGSAPPSIWSVFGDKDAPTAPLTPTTANPVPEAPATDVTLELTEKTSIVEGENPREVRQVAVRAEKPGYLHLWIEGPDPLTVPLLPDGDGKGYRRNLFYSVNKAEPPVLHYSVITDNTQPKAAGSVDLANRHITYETIATSMREIADPTGKCLRGLPLDLLHVGTDPLLIAVTDDEKMPPPEKLYLHLWHPTYYVTPTKLPCGIDTMAPRIGYSIQTLGKEVGRISQRDGGFLAEIKYDWGLSQGGYRGVLKLEQPVDAEIYAFSGGISPFRLVLTKKSQVDSFLQKQVEEDKQRFKDNGWKEPE